jgi:dephospho-CoA kinase
MDHQFKTLGITGPAASGKSTFCGVAEEMGFAIFKADEVVWELYQNNDGVIEALVSLCPECWIGGEVDRKTLRTWAFKNLTRMKELNKIINPWVFKNAEEFVNHGPKPQVLEIPLLFEGGYEKLCSQTLYINAPLKERRQRLQARGLSYSEIDLLLEAQKGIEESKAKADGEMDNQSSLEKFEAQIKTFLGEFM